ncbi:helix-turn-helix transcriptional regulator [Yoonia vestfoldensis]|uniref:helix-turn-helix transcriptional regulator n=1 Tax=Yoonia vestfoldensis TaxID=245188 RepID=UPI000365DDD8|nr:helix-turn-helix transcriptional regulator [Yoonia vestfoldensis]
MGRKGNSVQLRAALPESFQRRFGALIRQARTATGLIQADVARLVYGDETRSGEVSDVERGRHAPTPDTISRFCAGLQIDPVEVKRLREGCEQNWPVIFSPSITIDRKVVGRDDDVTALHNLLMRTQAVANLPGAVLRETGGIGKSMLARHYSTTYGHLYRGIWWINAADRQTAIASLCDLADALSLQKASERSDEALAKKTILALQAEIDPWLLVYDNAIRPRDLAGLVPVRGAAHLLYTSREGGWPNLHESPCRRLSTGQGVSLLEQESGRKEDRLGTERLVEALEGLPLALVCAGAWLRDVPSVSFEGYIERIEALLDDLPDTVEDYNNSVYAAISLSIERLGEDARLLLKTFAFLAPEGLDPDLVAMLDGKEKQSNPDEVEKLGAVPQSLWRLARDRPAIERAFADLERRSLMERNATGRQLHRLIQATQRVQLGDDADAWAATAAALISAGYPDGAAPGYAINFATCARLNSHVTALHAGPSGGPSTRAMDYLFNQASVYAWALRQDQLALRFSIANLRAKQRRGVPDNHLHMIMGWSNLAKDLGNLSRVSWAEQASAHAVRLAESNPVIIQAHYAISLSNHGEHLRSLAQKRGGAAALALFDRARARFHQAVRLDRIVNGPRSREVAIRLNNLAILYELQGRRGAASNIYKAALSIRRKVLPPDDAHLGEACNNLGALLLEQHKLAEARPLLEEALAIREAAFSANPNHPQTHGTARKLIALLLLDRDRVAAEVVATRHGIEMTKFSTTI